MRKTAPVQRGGPPLGRIERAILPAVDGAGGCVQREGLIDHAFPRLRARSADSPAATTKLNARKRACAHASVSRAIASLERKQLIVREHNHGTGRTFLRRSDLHVLPAWEDMARAEEDLAAHCGRVATQWSALAGRSKRRAAALRAERSTDGTEHERRADLTAIAKLEALMSARV